MDVTQEPGKKKELDVLFIPPETITQDNINVLVEKPTLINVANAASKVMGRALTTEEGKVLISVAKNIKVDQYKGKTYKQCVEILAKVFISTLKGKAGTVNINQLAHVHEPNDDDNLNLQEYSKAELMQTTNDEHQYKYSAHLDRRGNAIIDKDRADGKRSSPNNLAHALSEDQFKLMSYNTLQAVNRFLDPQNIEDIWKRPRSWVFSFDNITLPHRTVYLDSRNRVPNGGPNELRWKLNMTGQVGRIGDVRIQDTLKEVIAMRINSFWIPVSNPLDDYYNKINLYLPDFVQYTTMVEFVGPTESTPITRGYHFEFQIQRIRERLYLKPTIDTYKFSKPVAQVNEISFVFRSPFQIVQIDPDRGYFTVTPGLVTTFVGSIPHLLNTGDLIYVLNFASINTTINKKMNNEQGWIITRIDNVTFTINFDTSALIGPFTNIFVYYGSKRILAEIEFISLEH
jgi:hypothetical protein